MKNSSKYFFISIIFSLLFARALENNSQELNLLDGRDNTYLHPYLL